MKIGWDTETFLMKQRGKAETQATPRLVCLSYHVEGEAAPVLLDRAAAVAWFVERFEEGNDGPLMIAHNAAFDLRVMLRAVAEETGRDYTEEVFGWVWAGRVADTQIREQLWDIASGGLNPRGYPLDRLVHQFFPEEGAAFGGAKKKEPWAWRFRYAELAATPIADWPVEARVYAEEDATWALRVYDAQADRGTATNERYQTSAAWWLALAGARGLRVDYQWALDLDAFYVEEAERRADELRIAGLMNEAGQIGLDGKRGLFEAAFLSIGEEPWKTDKGAVKTDAAVLDYLTDRDASGDPSFNALVNYNRATKFRSTYLEPILSAGEWDEPLHTRYQVLVESGRTSASKPNVQNFPARAKAAEKGKRRAGHEIRGCFVPRPGHVFVQADYTALELVTLAQILTNRFYQDGGVSSLGTAINEGMDPHLRLAAQLAGTSYEDIVSDYQRGDDRAKSLRQLGKVANFGYPGGLSAKTFGSYAKAGYGVEVTESRAAFIRAAWFEAWPEMASYFDWVKGMRDRRDGAYVCEQHGPNRAMRGWRTRRTPSFTAAANTYFQGLAADGAKYAGWLVSKECYTDESSPLFGGAPVLFVHDELICEVPEAQAEGALARLEELMIRGMRSFTPDVTVRVEGQILRERWTK